MKHSILIILVLIGFAQIIFAQDSVQVPQNNIMSNVLGITAEGGITLGYTDYSSSKINYNAKLSLEYYFPSSGLGNFGVRAFGQTGFLAGTGAPAAALNPSNEFSTKIDVFGGGIIYTLSLGDAVYPWAALGLSDIWFYPKDGNGNQLPTYPSGKYMLAYNGDIGLRVMASQYLSVNFAGGLIIGTKDYLDGIKSGANNDLLYTATVGLSYYIGRDEQPAPPAPVGIRESVVTHDTVVITKEDTVTVVQHDTVVVTPPAEVSSVVLNGDANFEFNKSKLLSNAYPVLDNLVKTMKAHPDYRWEIAGYTDGIGSASYNMRLSKQRAQSVADYLTSQGVRRSTLKIVGYGKDDPIATNSTDEGRAMNRRVAIKLISKGN